MAFGSWFKNISKKTGPLIKTIGKIARFVNKTAAPVLSFVGNQIGGPTGNAMKLIGDKAQKVTDRWISNEGSPKRFDIPIIKQQPSES